MIYFILIIAVVVFTHEAAHRAAYIKSGLSVRYRNRFAALDKFISIVRVRNEKLPKSDVIDHWHFSQSTSVSRIFRIGMAGVVRGLVLSFVVFTLLALINLPTIFEGQFVVDGGAEKIRDEVRVVWVEDDSAAYSAGVRPNDVPVSFGTEHLRDSEHFVELQDHFEGKFAELIYSPGGVQSSINLEADNPGFEVKRLEVNRYGISAPIVGIVVMLQIGLALVSVLWGDTSRIAEIVDTLQVSEYLGFAYVFYALGTALVFYSVLNLIPIRPFDVGRIIFRRPYSHYLRDLLIKVRKATPVGPN